MLPSAIRTTGRILDPCSSPCLAAKPFYFLFIAGECVTNRFQRVRPPPRPLDFIHARSFHASRPPPSGCRYCASRHVPLCSWYPARPRASSCRPGGDRIHFVLRRRYQEQRRQRHRIWPVHPHLYEHVRYHALGRASGRFYGLWVPKRARHDERTGSFRCVEPSHDARAGGAVSALRSPRLAEPCGRSHDRP